MARFPLLRFSGQLFTLVLLYNIVFTLIYLCDRQFFVGLPKYPILYSNCPHHRFLLSHFFVLFVPLLSFIRHQTDTPTCLPSCDFIFSVPVCHSSSLCPLMLLCPSTPCPPQLITSLLSFSRLSFPSVLTLKKINKYIFTFSFMCLVGRHFPTDMQSQRAHDSGSQTYIWFVLKRSFVKIYFFLLVFQVSLVEN